MAKRLDAKAFEVGYDNLVIRAGDFGHITLAASQGTLKRGSVIDSNGKLLAAAGSGASPNQARYILADDTDATAAVTAGVYLNGAFVKESLVVADGYTLTADDIENLRDYGIMVESRFN